jgi:AbrB family looped-hinge helix DNA binding protein
MRTTIDEAGRIVVPKPMRDELGLRGGDALEITVRDRVIEIDVPLTPIHIEERSGVRVGVPDEDLPVLTNEEVRGTLERTRR